MSIRRILVPVGGTDAARPAVEAAFRLARKLAAHVQAVHVRPDPRNAIPVLGEGISGAMVEELIALAEREGAAQATAARALFETARAEAQVPLADAPGAPGEGGATAEWLERTGREEDHVAHLGRLADVIVAGRPVGGNDLPPEATLHAALFETGRPVLVIADRVPDLIGRRIALAWNGSAEAARSITFAMELLAAAEFVVVFSSADDGTREEAARDIADYLEWHGVSASLGALPGDAPSVGAGVLAACETWSADLLVMGAYTHSRLRQLILGGVTRHILEHGNLPVFMAH